MDKDVELAKIQIYADSLNSTTYTLIASFLSVTFLVLFFYFGLLYQSLSFDVVGLVLFVFLAFVPLLFSFQRIRKHRRELKKIQHFLDMIEQGKKLPKIEELTKDIF